MGTQVADEQAFRMTLLEIRPLELKFTFEVKKQSSCNVHLTNHSDEYVAFKVKTTSPKKYCVRPNIGVVKPKSTYDFAVTMQAQKLTPLDMQCKDKFLIQSTVAPFGISEEDITPDLFAKDSGNYIEERKLKVVLASPLDSPVVSPVKGIAKQEPSYSPSSHSPVLSPVNGITKQEPSYSPSSHSPVLSPVNGITKQEPSYSPSSHSPVLSSVNGITKQEQPYVISTQKEKLLTGTENLRPPQMLDNNIEDTSAREEIKSAPPVHETVRSPSKSGELIPDKVMESEMQETVQSPPNAGKITIDKDAKGSNMQSREDIKELNSKFIMLDAKLIEAEMNITRLKEEKTDILHEKEMLKKELATMKRKSGLRQVQRGFPPLFVTMIALISLAVGFWLRA